MEQARGRLAREKKAVEQLKDYVHLETHFGFETSLSKDSCLSLCNVG